MNDDALIIPDLPLNHAKYTNFLVTNAAISLLLVWVSKLNLD